MRAACWAGPVVGGLVLTSMGIGGAFAISVVGYSVAVIAACRLRHRNSIAPMAGGAVFAHVVEGLMIARRDRRLVAILTITIIYNVFGWPFTAMIPVIGQDNLHLDAGGIGILASMDGIGAFVSATVIALWARPRYFARLYIGAVFAYMTLMIGVAQAPTALFAGAALLSTGLANSGVQRHAGDADLSRGAGGDAGRLYGVLSLCIGSGLLGFVNIGLMAEWIGAPWATTISGIEGLVAMALTWRWWRQIGTTGAA